jgi:Pyridoxamine 5'-phosphate oxidase
MTREEFVEFVRSARLGVIATVGADGHPQAALVELAVTRTAKNTDASTWSSSRNRARCSTSSPSSG